VESPVQPQASEQGVEIGTAGVTLAGDLAIPHHARGVVLFAHGSGSGRHSPRNRFVARGLREGRLATLLIDLLTEDEERVDMVTRHLRFDIGLLAVRLIGSIDWLKANESTRDQPIGLFGASTGAAAALVAAAKRKREVGAVVSRGGRPDLAGEALPEAGAPTLLIVGGADEQVIELNSRAKAAMSAETSMAIVPGATHLFEEPGKLEEVVELARDWFEEHLVA
jgi:putative phosphoribosyl transferase